MKNRKHEMETRKPANGAHAPRLDLIGFPFCISDFLFSIFLPSILAALFVTLPAPIWAQSGTAVVTGADRVFVRRGPGSEFAPFATVDKGSTVEVRSVQGEWALIVTAGGQSGYV